jgi:hypothetical protein
VECDLQSGCARIRRMAARTSAMKSNPKPGTLPWQYAIGIVNTSSDSVVSFLDVAGGRNPDSSGRFALRAHSTDRFVNGPVGVYS